MTEIAPRGGMTRPKGPTVDAMPHTVIVTFALDAVPGMGRHRVSVWNDDGAMLCPPSAQSPADVFVREGATFFVEASVPRAASSKAIPSRDERRWPLRARRDATAVLKLGESPTYGLSTAIEIHVEGAEQSGAARKTG
jgi:hypothetical protein